jgi:hypothetical protein
MNPNNIQRRGTSTTLGKQTGFAGAEGRATVVALDLNGELRLTARPFQRDTPETERVFRLRKPCQPPRVSDPR